VAGGCAIPKLKVREPIWEPDGADSTGWHRTDGDDRSFARAAGGLLRTALHAVWGPTDQKVRGSSPFGRAAQNSRSEALPGSPGGAFVVAGGCAGRRSRHRTSCGLFASRGTAGGLLRQGARRGHRSEPSAAPVRLNDVSNWARRVRRLRLAMAAVLVVAAAAAGAWAYRLWRDGGLEHGEVWTDRTVRAVLSALAVLAVSFLVVMWKLSAARYYLGLERARRLGPGGRPGSLAPSRPGVSWARISVAVVGATVTAGTGVATNADLRIPPPGESRGLAHTEWQLVALGPPGEVRDVPVDTEAVASGVLRLDGRGHYSAEFCGAEWGRAHVRGQQVRLERTAELAPGCSGPSVYTYEAALAHPLDWVIKNGRLTLSNPQGVLVFHVRDSIYPHQSARDVLTGERNGWQYRVAVEPRTDRWHTSRGWFEYRRGPGHRWSFDPLYSSDGTIEAASFRYLPGLVVVAGFAPLRSAYVEYVAGDGSPPRRLPVITAAAKHRWTAFAGQIPSSSAGGTLRAVDAEGRTLMTCAAGPSGTDREDFDCSLRGAPRAISARSARSGGVDQNE
jgi:hypothetical protein